ncbi:MAG: BlaI/MecI/CopY family transcriptional regulator [Acidobacteriota bacterium]
MSDEIYDRLSRRERQIMDILFEQKEATAEEVRSRLPDPPSYSAARAMLAKLEEKGYIRHSERNLRYVYRPAVSRRKVQASAASRLLRVFFDRSLADAVRGLLDTSSDRLSDRELDQVAEMIEQERQRRRNEK